MKRFLVFLTVALALVWAVAPAAAQSGRRAPSGTVMLHATRVALGVGVTKGDGYLRYKGDDFKFKLTGLNAVGVGITTINATGDVYDLRRLEDFPGRYYGFEGGGTFIEGSKGLVIKNSKGVVIILRASQSGLDLKLGNEGLSITPAWD